MADVKCILCGEKIEEKKGQGTDAFKRELAAGRHHVCATAHQSVVQRHNIGAGQHMNAVISALFELFPELKETKAYKAYDTRVIAAEAEMLEMFPHLKAIKEAEEKEEKEEKRKENMQTGTEREEEIRGITEGKKEKIA